MFRKLPPIVLGLCLISNTIEAQSIGDLRLSIRNLSFSARDLYFSTADRRFSTHDILAPVQASPREQRFRLSGDVLFEFDKDAIHPDAEPVLAGLAKRIQSEFSGAPIRIEGHTDAKGPDSYNLDLSKRRANSVKAWLQSHGFSVPIQATGYGETQPVERNELPDGSDNPVGRQQNRRVEIVVEKTAR